MFWSRSEYFVTFYIYFFVVVQSLPGVFLSGFSLLPWPTVTSSELGGGYLAFYGSIRPGMSAIISEMLEKQC